MIEKMMETMIHLARIGHIIFVGRAAHLITAKYPRAVHVRVVGSLEARARRVAASKGALWDETMAEVKKVDYQRKHFISTYFHVDLDDPTLYDMIFNTDRISVEEAARLIAHLVSAPDFRTTRVEKLRELRHQVLG